MRFHTVVRVLAATSTLCACAVESSPTTPSTEHALAVAPALPLAPGRAAPSPRRMRTSFSPTRGVRSALGPMLAIPSQPSDPPVAPTAPSWSQAHGSTGDDFAGGMTTDGAGNVIVAGCFSATIDMGCGTMSPSGTVDLFVVKYAQDGTCVWSQHFGGTGEQWATSLVADSSGNLYVSGTFSGRATFGASALVSAGGYDAFVAAFTPDGAPSWASSIGGRDDDDGNAVAVVGSNVVIVGDFGGSITAAGVPLTSRGGTDSFVASYAAANGADSWAMRIGGEGEDLAFAVARLGTGFAVGGMFESSIDLGGGPVVSAGRGDGFVAAFDASGAFAWNQTLGGAGDDTVSALASAPDGGIVGAGYFTGSASFAASALPSMSGAGAITGFVAKLDAQGGPSWSRAIDATGLLTAYAVAAGANGDVLVAGSFEGTATLPNGPIAARGTDDAFVARYDASGAPIGASTYGGVGSSGATAVGVPAAGSFCAAGYFSQSIDLGAGSVTGRGGSDVFALAAAAP